MVRVNDTRNPSTKVPSLATHLLLEYLQRWPRRSISAALLEQDEPQQYLTSGALARGLQKMQTSSQPPGERSNSAVNRRSSVIGYFDEHFPSLLRHIPDPPLVLYYRGCLHALSDAAVAVVGARRCTHMGRHNAYLLGRGLSEAHINVVSGLALGIDGAAHQGALSSSSGAPTVAILGGGLAQTYPRRHTGLARQIVAAGGLLLSEYPDFWQPRPYHFPERNRLISGLCQATVVVEADIRSGSLITARFAAEQGRDVFAMPGPVQNETSAGCHQLIQEGAALVTATIDVLHNLGIEPSQLAPTRQQGAGPGNPGKHSATPELSAEAQRLYAHIQGYAVTVDELLLASHLEQAPLTQALVELELAGFVEQGPLGYIRTPR